MGNLKKLCSLVTFLNLNYFTRVSFYELRENFKI